MKKYYRRKAHYNEYNQVYNISNKIRKVKKKEKKHNKIKPIIFSFFYHFLKQLQTIIYTTA
jgi:hypothetical protein